MSYKANSIDSARRLWISAASAAGIVASGMQGDRAAIVFAPPEEISAFIRKECP